MLLIIQIFLPWSVWFQNESLYFLSQMKTEVLLLTNPTCFLPIDGKRRSHCGQLPVLPAPCHSGTLLQQCGVCWHLPPRHTAREMIDGKIDSTQKKSHTELCETGRDGREGVTAPLGAALPSTTQSSSGPGRNRVCQKAATVIAALYKCTKVK